MRQPTTNTKLPVASYSAAEVRPALPVKWRYALALAAGAMTPLSFAPFNWWPLGFVTLAFFYYCLRQTTPREALRLGFVFGFGLFGVGASWIYVSIHDYGLAPPIVAFIITLVFVLFMALYNAVASWLWRRYVVSALLPTLTFAATWVVCEWFRTWFLTGFPWLLLGYAHVTSPLSGVAPVFGVYGASFMVALCGALLAEIAISLKACGLKSTMRHPALSALIIVQVLTAGSAVIDWTHPAIREPVRVGLVQGNIPQELKFDADAVQDGLNRYVQMSAPLWKQDLLVWPETAIPLVYQNQEELIASLAAQARSNNTALITGVFYRSELGLHNSIVVEGNGSGVWLKQKLVPFGEYVPFHEWIDNVLQMFVLPLSSLAVGPADQTLLNAAGLRIAPYICYEVVYPDFARRVGRDADLLLTVSNDTWFGASFGPLQHLQMAAMRARELGRYMVRATNNGVSAIINSRGQVVAETAQFKAETLQGNVLVYEGMTPFGHWGSLPVWLLCAAVIGFSLRARLKAVPDPATTPRN